MGVYVIHAPSDDDAPDGNAVPLTTANRARIYQLEAEARKAQAEMMDEWLASPAGQAWLGHNSGEGEI